MPLGKSINPLILPVTSEIVLLLFFYKDGLGIKITPEGWYASQQRNQTKSTPI